jgi:hypothetical protein
MPDVGRGESPQVAIYQQHPEHGRLFVGFQPRECGEHRTVGDYRAWCFDCGEWCYPNAPCVRCEVVTLRESDDEPLTNWLARAHPEVWAEWRERMIAPARLQTPGGTP